MKENKEISKVIEIPEFSLILLMGAPGAGKSTFARKHFKSTQILSSDFFRGMACDDENNQDANQDAFELIYTLLEKRLKRKKLTVIDATNVRPAARAPFHQFANEYNCPVFIIVLLLSEEECFSQNMQRQERNLPPEIIKQHYEELLESLPIIEKEAFQKIFYLKSLAEINQTKVKII